MIDEYLDFDEDELDEDAPVACSICSCLIGDEVLYGDTWDGRQVCAGCAGIEDNMRCKVFCSYKQPVNDGVHLHFTPVVDGSEENKEFFRYTPGGQFMLYTVNLAVAEKYEVGKQYYVDFTEA